MKQLPKLSEMEHITSKELGEKLDVILDRITSEDIAMIIDHQDKSYVLCPAHWFELPRMKHIEAIIKNAVRYAAVIDDGDLEEIADIVKEFASVLSHDSITALLAAVKGRKQSNSNTTWVELERALEEALSIINQKE